MNITEFAQRAGVSKSAVSRYFNGGYLSEEKRRAIEKAVGETGYAPSASARSVRTRVTKLVGVILPKLSSESCSRVTEGISKVLDEHGYQMLLVNTANKPKKEVEYLDLFRHNRVDAVIFLASIFTANHKAVLRKMKIPVIIVGQRYEGISCVYHDDYGAAFSLGELLLKRGAKKPAYIGVTERDEAAGLSRHDGFFDAMKKHNVTVDKKHRIVAEFTMESGYKAAEKLFSVSKKPDALFCATDNIAAGVMLYCKDKGISIPGDIMICAVGDSKIGKITPTSLTSAHLHYRTSGIDAAEMLLTELTSDSKIHRNEMLDFYIEERESTNRQM